MKSIQRVIRAALEASGVSATDVDLLSMHGTGEAILRSRHSASSERKFV